MYGSTRHSILLLLTLLCLAGCFFSGCASRPSDPSAPEVEIPESWTAVAPAELAAEPLAAWWKDFGDARLDLLVDEALERNYDLRATAAAVTAARAQARVAGADLRPQVQAGIDAASRQQVFVGFPIPGRSGPLITSSDAFNLHIDISWEADLWGRLRAGRQAARSDAEAAREDHAAARQALAAETVRAWFTWLESALQVELAERTLESRRTTTERAMARYRSGVGEPLDVRLARSNEALAQSVVALRRRLHDAGRRQLEILLGRYPAGELKAGMTKLPEAAEELPAVMPAELVTRRPDLRAAERRLQAAGWRVSEARRALYPRLGFAASGGTTSERIGDLLNSDFTFWNLAGGLLQPLFQGGRLRAAVEFAEASRERVLAEYVELVLRAFAEVETALAADGWLLAEHETLAISLAEAAAAAELAEDRYVAGIGEFLDVLESQRQAFAAESRLLAVRRQRLVNRVDIHAALGGDIP